MKMNKAKKATLFLFSAAVLLAGGAPGVRGQSVDSFDPNADGPVEVVVVQPDGKILIGGGFTTLSPNGGAAVTRNYIARLNPDGTLDTAFDPNANLVIWSIAVQADGKVLAGGDFTSIGGQGRNHIARLVGGVTPTPTPSCTNDTWTATSATNAPTARLNHTAIWTGSEAIVWGGESNIVGRFNTGRMYNPNTDTWTNTSTINAPTARNNHIAVWTASQMIVWGGYDVSDSNTGGKYNPASDSWTATSITNAPSARLYSTAIWTGSEMIVWGGQDSSNASFDTGGRYNPDMNTWTATNTINAPTGRRSHTAVWTGSEMIVWGGNNGTVHLNTGGRYNPATDTWTATSTANAPTMRSAHAVVWTGNEMIVWGGVDPSDSNTGGRYNPATDTWTATSTSNAPSARYLPTAIWTASGMIIWGGYSSSGFFNTGGRYNPATDAWTATSTSNAPSARFLFTTIWTGSEMIVWGGENDGGSLDTGGRYCAQPPTSIPTVSITGKVLYCSNPTLDPVPNVMLNVTGGTTTSTLSNVSGDYVFSSLAAGGSYVVTPSKAARTPGSAGIDTIDVVVTQLHFLTSGTLLSGCKLTAGDVNGDTLVNTVDVVAIQRFFLGLSTGIANVGKYKFSPASRSYPGIVSDQTGQNYDALVLGDVASGFVE
jgi:N-acetylneuraminic acid mutarotase